MFCPNHLRGLRAIPELPEINVDFTDKYYLIPNYITDHDYKLNLIDFYPRFDEVHSAINEPIYKGCLNFLDIMYLFKNAQISIQKYVKLLNSFST